MKKIFLLLLLTTLSFCGVYAQQTYLHCGTLIDGKNNNAMTEMTLIIEGNKIVAVEKGYKNPKKNDTVIDLKSHTVMPGLMDMHIHIEEETSPTRYSDQFREDPADVALKATQYCKTTLMAGFTSVRDLGGSGVNISLRDAINKGYIVGPRIYTAGKAIGTTGGHADPTNGVRSDLMGNPGPKDGVINSPSDARKAVRQRYKNSADVIKITATGGVLSVAKDGQGPQFTEEELAAIISTAKDYGMITAAHAHGDEGMRRAVAAGITSIEHGTLMSEATMDLMKEKGTYYVPTITAGKSVEELAKIEGYFPPVIVPKALAIGPKIQETFSKAYKKGVKIAFGTDAAVFKHGDNWKEFVYMTEAGMPAMEAIQSASMTPSIMLGIDDQYGSIEAGKMADIIATPKNPLEDINTMSNVAFVMKGGVVYKGD